MSKIFLCALVLCLHWNMVESKKSPLVAVMVFAPHPDDDILGCGGTIMHHVQKGHKVTIVYMTSGGAAQWDSTKGKLETIRENEAKRAAFKLGVEDLIFLRERDGELTVSPSAISKTANLLRRYAPKVIYIPHKNDGHKDHRATHKIVAEALRKEDDVREPSILCYEVWTPLERVSRSEDISDVMEKKLEALLEHKSQLEHLNFIEAIKGLNSYRGLMSRKGSYAECFFQLKLS